MRLIETYIDLTQEYMWTGVLSQDFFCGPIVNSCWDHKFKRETLETFYADMEASKNAA